jgi:hypothetical protein
MELKLGLKVGQIELQFEGAIQTFEAKFESIFTQLVELGKEKFRSGELNSESPKTPPSDRSVPPMTVKAVAAKFGGGSGSELLNTAIASLAVIKGKETFSRQEINEEMKLATGYYKTSYSSNLSNYLETIAKQGTIIEVSKDVYALKESVRAEMELKLAQQ